MQRAEAVPTLQVQIYLSSNLDLNLVQLWTSSNLSKNSEGRLWTNEVLYMCSDRRWPMQTSYYALSKLKEIQKRSCAHARSNLYHQKISVKAYWEYCLPFDNTGGRTLSTLCFVLWRQAVNTRTHCISTSTFSFQSNQNSKKSILHLGLTQESCFIPSRNESPPDCDWESLSHQSDNQSSSHIFRRVRTY